MRYVLKKKPTKYDIPLAGARSSEMSGNAISHITDFSHEILGNSYAAFQNITSYPDSENVDPLVRNRLISKNMFSDIILTDEFYYDSTTSSRIPLWYKHPFSKIMYSSSCTSKEVKRKFREDKIETDRTVYGLIPSTGSYIIPRGSLYVYIGNTGAATADDNISIDYVSGSVTVKSSLLTGLPENQRYFTVRYKLISTEIQIEEYGSPYSAIMCIAADSNYTYFHTYILSNSKDSFKVRYMSKSEETVFETSESTSYINISSRVDTKTDIASSFKHKMFYYDSSDIYVQSTNSDHKYCFMPEYIRNSKISIIESNDGSFLSSWKPILTNGIVENDTGSFSSGLSSHVSYIKERAKFITDRIIAVTSDNLRHTISSGGIKGIKVIRESDNLEIGVLFVNSYRGTIELDRSISRKDTIYVSYSTAAVGQSISKAANPMDFFRSVGFNSKTHGILIAAIDSRMVPPGRKNGIYYKPIRLYYSGRPKTFTYLNIDSELNNATAATRNTYRAEMGLPPLFYSESTLYRVEPMCIFYVSSIYDADAYEIFDLRTYGGGLTDYQYSFYDHSSYDGERTDTSSSLRIEIPEWLKEDVKQKCMAWSPNVAKSDYPEDEADIEAEQIINSKIKKFSLIGTDQEVIIGN